MNNIIQQDSTDKRLVPIAYYRMFYLRLIGLNYEEIAEKVGYTAQYIRLLFSKGHVLNGLWIEWLKDAKENCIDEALIIMVGNLPDIVRARVEHAKGNDPGAVMSAKIIFDYTLGHPEDRVRNNTSSGPNGGPKTFAEWAKQQTLEEEKNKLIADNSKENDYDNK